MKQKHLWEITDEFWAIAEPLIPKKPDTLIKHTKESLAEAVPLYVCSTADITIS